MNKNLIALFFIICGLYFSCSKASKFDNVPQNTGTKDTSKQSTGTKDTSKQSGTALVKIELLSGGGQTDTIGNPLSNPIIVKVTKNGTPTSGYSVQFQASGCNQDNIISTFSQPDGTAGYVWSLANDVGQQSLKAYVLNSNNQKADSVTVTATGLTTGHGWHNSGCSLQSSFSASAFCKLSSGRLFTCYNGGKTYLRYSDDNGVSWNAVKSLGNGHTITWVMATPSDELFAFTEGNDGTFHSTDAGKTWSNLGVPPFNTEIFSSIVCTSSGKLIAASSVTPPLCISVDKGITWASVPFSAFVPQNMNSPSFHDPIEDKDGNLYIVEQQNGNMFKSADGGKIWNLVPETGYNAPGDVFSLYIDNNNWFYKSTVQFQPGIYISKDKGGTYNMLIPGSPVSEAENMSIQSDGNFYYEAGPNLYLYDQASNSVKTIFGSGNAGPYVVAKNNNIVVGNLGKGYIKYYTK
jgi:photosystem II stability/assembly factor-like uncharacterized protein